MHAVLITNTGWSMARHRYEQIRWLVESGWAVSAIAAFSLHEEKVVRDLGADTYTLSCRGAGADPLRNSGYFFRLTKLLHSLDPDIVHAFSLKICIWAVPAAVTISVPAIVCSFPGIGVLGTRPNSRGARIAKIMCRFALGGRKTKVIFQNKEDMDLFVSKGLVSRSKCNHIPGCGVDIVGLIPTYDLVDPPRFVMASRMLKTKGVESFIEAARKVKQRHPEAEFLLVGPGREDWKSNDEDYLSAGALRHLTRDGAARWIGPVSPKDVERIMRGSTAVILLSRYSEGVPRCLIEAIGLGKPVITTDWPGCRDVVANSNGFLCSTVDDAAKAMCELIEKPWLAREMGMNSRQLSYQFDRAAVMRKTMKVYHKAGLPLELMEVVA